MVSTIAGLAGASGTTDGTNGALTARFNRPMGIAVDTSDNLYVTDEANHTIRMINQFGTNWNVITIAGLSTGGGGSSDGTNSNGQFEEPYGIAVNSSGTVFVTDYYSHTIRQLVPSGANWVVATIAGIAGSHGSADGGGSGARFDYPTGIAAGIDGNLYVADNGNNTVRRLTLVGTNWNVFTVAGVAGSPGNIDGFGSNVRLNGPFGIAVDNNTNVYVTDANNDTIRGAARLSSQTPGLCTC